jgi:hypothetical protein
MRPVVRVSSVRPGLAALSVAIAAVTLAAAAPSDTPRLWRAEVVDQAVTGHPVFVCADKRARTGFTEALPDINGEACGLIDQPIRRKGAFIARCHTSFAIVATSSTVKGDMTRDFTVSTRISTRPADVTKAEPRTESVQVRHYRDVGACPAGWSVGDAAAAGAVSVSNSLTNTTRPLATPFAPPAP